MEEVANLLGIACAYPEHADQIFDGLDPVINYLLPAAADKPVKFAWSALKQHRAAGRRLSLDILLAEVVVEGETGKPAFVLGDYMKTLQAVQTRLEGLATDDLAEHVDGLVSAVLGVGRRRAVASFYSQAHTYIVNGTSTDEVVSYLDARVSSLPSLRKLPESEGYAGADMFDDDPTRYTIPTGFADADKYLGGGFGSDDFVIVGARHNVGKSALIVAFARNQIFRRAAQNIDEQRIAPEDRLDIQDTRPPVHTLIVSLEMPARQLRDRLACDMLDIHATDRRRDGWATCLARSQVAEQIGGAGGYKDKLCRAASTLTIVDRQQLGGATVGQVVTAIRDFARARRRADPHARILVCIDYLQKLQLPEGTKVQSRQLEVKEQSDKLFALCKSENVCVVALMQVLRAADQHRPNSQELREAGDPAADADWVLLLHCASPTQRQALQAKCGQEAPSEPKPKSERRQRAAALAAAPEVTISNALQRAHDELELICDKGRDGPASWVVPLHFDRAHNRVTDGYHDSRGQTINYLVQDEVKKVINPARANSKTRDSGVGSHDLAGD